MSHTPLVGTKRKRKIPSEAFGAPLFSAQAMLFSVQAMLFSAPTGFAAVALFFYYF